MRIRGLLIDEQAVSSVVATVLLVGVVVVLSSLLGVFAFDVFDQDSAAAPEVVFEYDYDEGATELTVTHDSGETLDGSTITFRKQDGTDLGDWSANSEVAATDSVTFGPSGSQSPSSVTASPIDPSDTVLIVWEQPRENGDTAVIGTWEGPDA